MSLSVGLVWAVFAFIFAYLAVNTPKKHGALQIFNYLASYLTIIVAGYIAYASESSEMPVTAFISSWNQYAGYFLAFIFLYFGIYLFNVMVYGEEDEQQE